MAICALLSNVPDTKVFTGFPIIRHILGGSEHNVRTGMIRHVVTDIVKGQTPILRVLVL